jgi:hypothetical protein
VPVLLGPEIKRRRGSIIKVTIGWMNEERKKPGT